MISKAQEMAQTAYDRSEHPMKGSKVKALRAAIRVNLKFLEDPYEEDEKVDDLGQLNLEHRATVQFPRI